MLGKFGLLNKPKLGKMAEEGEVLYTLPCGRRETDKNHGTYLSGSLTAYRQH
jgi:hypothetical protein